MRFGPRGTDPVARFTATRFRWASSRSWRRKYEAFVASRVSVVSRMCTRCRCPIMSKRPIPANQATLSEESVLPVPRQCARTPPPAKTLVSPLRTSTCCPPLGTNGGDDLEIGIRREPLARDVAVRLVEHERLVGAHLVPHLAVTQHLGAERGAVGAHHEHVAARLHVAGPPVVRPLARRERRGFRAPWVVEGDVHLAQLGGLDGRVEVGGVGAHVGPLDPGLGHVVRHGDEHLIGGIGGGDGRRRLDAVLTRANRESAEQEAVRSDASTCSGANYSLLPAPSVHAAPAFIRSCKCTIPSTFRPPSSTGSAMMPCCSITPP